MAEFDPQRAVPATVAAYYADVTVQAIVNWRNRGHLATAKDDHGDEIRDARGRPKYRLIDVARCEARNTT